MITSLQLARLIAVYSKVTKTKDANSIAGAIGLAPLYIINAYYEGEKSGLFTLKRDKTGIKSVNVSAEQYDSIALTPSNFGEDFVEISNSIVELMTHLNARKSDLSRDQLMLWSGASPFMMETVLHVAVESEVLAQYEIKDKNDQKSVYKFITLFENREERFGKSQFKNE